MLDRNRYISEEEVDVTQDLRSESRRELRQPNHISNATNRSTLQELPDVVQPRNSVYSCKLLRDLHNQLDVANHPVIIVLLAIIHLPELTIMVASNRDIDLADSSMAVLNLRTSCCAAME
jgi:hypothetical protein